MAGGFILKSSFKSFETVTPRQEIDPHEKTELYLVLAILSKP